MMKNILFGIALFTYSAFCFAEICPSVEAIKSASHHGWKIYDSDDDKPLTHERATYFRENAYAFVLAEWTKNRLKSDIHCYYRNKSGATIEAYVAKKNLTPAKEHKNFWYQVSGAMHCAAKVEECSFKTITQPTHLARK